MGIKYKVSPAHKMYISIDKKFKSLERFISAYESALKKEGMLHQNLHIVFTVTLEDDKEQFRENINFEEDDPLVYWEASNNYREIIGEERQL